MGIKTFSVVTIQWSSELFDWCHLAFDNEKTSFFTENHFEQHMNIITISKV